MTLSDDGFNQAHRNWQRAFTVARRVGGDDRFPEVSPSAMNRSEHNTEFTGAKPKTMDLQYFLEMVDLKHRHGSNLRLYHMCWRNSSSNENFFYWLDYGDGKNIELSECSREKLEKEQVRYLNREERLNYMVMIDETGRFRWAKNNELVWTNTARFKDSLQGIVGIEDDVPQFRGNSTVLPEPTWDLSPSSSSSSSSSLSTISTRSTRHSPDGVFSNRAPKHFTDEYTAKMMKVVHASPAAAFQRLTGKASEKEDKWLFVSRVWICGPWLLDAD